MIRQIDMLREEIDRREDAARRATELAFTAQSTAMAAALASAEKAVSAALAAQKEAVAVQAETLKQRADVQNEWRASLSDVLTRAMPRIEAEAVISRVTERIQEMITAQQHLITRAEIDSLRQRESERVAELNDRLTRVESLAVGAQTNRTSMYALIGAVGVVITVVVVMANLLTT